MILSVTKEFVIIFSSRDGRRRIPSSETRGSTSYSWKRKQQELEEAGEGGLAHPARPRDLQLLRGLCPCGPQLLQRLLHHPSLLSPGVPTPSCCHLFCYLSLMDKSLWLVVLGLLHTAAHDLCVQHLLTAFRTAVSI
jgi:hypothetical protein